MNKKGLAYMKSIVLDLLESDNRCKKDDLYLFSRVIEIVTQSNGTYNAEIKQLVLFLQKYGKELPKFSTVMRSRQDLQHNNSDLKDEFVAEKRKEQEYRFKAFFRRD